MSFNEQAFLRDHTGMCIFPLVETGRKTLCGAMTFEENGQYPPFCKEHTEEIKKILAFIKSNRQKKKVLQVKPQGG